MNTPAKTAKRLGCKSLAQVSEVSGVSVSTLRDWHESRPYVFRSICTNVWADTVAVPNARVSVRKLIEQRENQQ